MRFLVGRPVVLVHTFLDDETVLTPSAVTVTVTREGESTPVSSGAAVNAAGVWTYSPGLLSQAVYAVTWDGGATGRDTELVEVTGGLLFTIPELRASDVDLTATRYPAAVVKAVREQVEVEFQRITGRSFVPRTTRVAVDYDGDGDTAVVPIRDITAVTAVYAPDGTLLAGPWTIVEPQGIIGGFINTATNVALSAGVYTAVVTYGFPSVPADVKRAAVMLARAYITDPTSGVPDRATSFQPANGGTYTIATPGRAGFETGFPDVDAILGRYAFRILNDVFGGF